jgi:hypothetical protein
MNLRKPVLQCTKADTLFLLPSDTYRKIQSSLPLIPSFLPSFLLRSVDAVQPTRPPPPLTRSLVYDIYLAFSLSCLVFREGSIGPPTPQVTVL